MAQTIDLEVYLGMNSDELRAELQKAQNELKQFKSQLKRSTDTKEIQELNQKIANTEGTINTLNNALGNTAKKTGDATQSIVNLSRVAQDAPYGFIGIANNINPLLESFQRLQKEAGGTSGALKSIVGGIAGPAGIGLAVGIATSLLTVYSKEIAEFFKSPTDKLKEFREELKKTNAEVYKIVGEIQANRTVGLNLVNLIVGGNPTQQEEALKRLKALYNENKAVQDAKLGNDKQFYVNLVNLASKYEEASGKEQNINKILEQAYTERKKIEAKRNLDLRNVKQEFGAGGVPVYNIEEVKKRIRDNAQKQLDEIDKTIVKAKQKQLEFVTSLTSFETANKKTTQKGKKTGVKNVDEFSQQLREDNKQISIEMFKRKQMFDKLKDISKPILQEKPEQAINAEKKRLSDIAAFGKGKMTGDFGESLAGKTSAFYEAQKKIAEQKGLDIQLTKQQTEAYLKMADTISTYATNAVMGLFNALQNGVGIGEAVANMFIDLAKQIAAAAIKAAIFQSIMAAFSGGGTAGVAAANATTGGFTSLFKGFLGLASGGIVTKPTLAMVGEGNESEAVMPLSKLSGFLNTSFNAGAMSGTSQNGGQFVLKGSDLVLALQRSNNNLNLRRGV